MHHACRNYAVGSKLCRVSTDAHRTQTLEGCITGGYHLIYRNQMPLVTLPRQYSAAPLPQKISPRSTARLTSPGLGRWPIQTCRYSHSLRSLSHAPHSWAGTSTHCRMDHSACSTGTSACPAGMLLVHTVDNNINNV